MDLFFAKIDDLINYIGENKLIKYKDNLRNFSSNKRLLEHCCSRYMINYLCQKMYKIDNVDIITINKKPQLRNNEIYFSSSHSNEYIAIVFDNCPCAIDVEKIKDINLDKMSNRYNKNFKSLEDFYQFWTQYECRIKLGTKPNSAITKKFNENYIYTITSTNTTLNFNQQNFKDLQYETFTGK